MSAGIAVERMAVPALNERYETLRSAALGAGLPLEARGGLALFLRRGMWGWARAVTTSSTPPRPTRSLAAPSTAQDETIIHLFATMAMTSNTRSAHERIAQSPVASLGA